MSRWYMCCGNKIRTWSFVRSKVKTNDGDANRTIIISTPHCGIAYIVNLKQLFLVAANNKGTQLTFDHKKKRTGTFKS